MVDMMGKPDGHFAWNDTATQQAEQALGASAKINRKTSMYGTGAWYIEGDSDKGPWTAVFRGGELRNVTLVEDLDPFDGVA